VGSIDSIRDERRDINEDRETCLDERDRYREKTKQVLKRES